MGCSSGKVDDPSTEVESAAVSEGGLDTDPALVVVPDGVVNAKNSGTTEVTADSTTPTVTEKTAAAGVTEPAMAAAGKKATVVEATAEDIAGEPMTKQFSALSQKALGKLAETEIALATIESRLKSISSSMPTLTAADVSSVRKELAEMEAQAKKLEGVGVDDVYTGELESGKQAAKATKKDMLNRFEEAFTTMDRLFAELKKREAGQSAAAPL
mmetsp:Transcript_60932/g.145205  ORF Transcript_60932/g.145205 Transcript_60932/m.145205 type:complete len:214 (-) Transcript_60932:41-682(-)